MSEWKREDGKNGPVFRMWNHRVLRSELGGLLVEVDGFEINITSDMLTALGYARITDADIMRRALEIWVAGISSGRFSHIDKRGGTQQILADAAYVLDPYRKRRRPED